MTPDVSKPTITVQTRWLGASPAEIEKEIIEKQEEQLKGVKGMIEFNSECRKGRGEITLEFSPGADIRERRDIRLALETVVSHSDAHPLARSSRGQPWDPAPIQWSYERFAGHAGLPLVSGVGMP